MRSKQKIESTQQPTNKSLSFKSIMKTFVFVLPYIFVEFANTLFVTVDKSLSNSLGTTAIIVFSSFMTLNWAIDTIQNRVYNAYSIVLARDRQNTKSISNSAMLIEVGSSLVISAVLLIFAKQITYIFHLEEQAREILTIILRLKAIQLPIYAIGLVAENILKIEKKTRKILIASIVSAVINIGGDILSIELDCGETGIYVATIVSSLVNTILLLIFARYKFAKISWTYVKQILFFTKDLLIDNLVHRVVTLYYGHVASSFGTDIYAVHCVCATVVDLLCEVIEGYYAGLLVEYSNDIDNQRAELLKKVDTIEIYGMVLSAIIIPIFIYPMWLVLGNAVPWAECNPYIWLYAFEFIATVSMDNYKAYLSAAKNTQSLRLMALIGGVCVRMPFCFLILKLNIGIVGLALACSIDRAVRAIYLRIYIKIKRRTLPV